MPTLLKGFRRMVNAVNVKREKKYFAAVGRQLVMLTGSVFRYACYIHVFTEYVCEITLCVGPSMMPTLNQFGDIILTESWSLRRNQLQRGDVVIAISPRNPNAAICKRILGMPGDRVCTNAGEGCVKTFETVPKGKVWLQGDNLYNSTDSRLYGAVPLGLVKARAFARVWPPQEVCWIPTRYDPDEWPREAFAMPDAETTPDTTDEIKELLHESNLV
eukprot:m.91888 g.91888  ORF g.91888 m.91888 type:complete len:217 (-) comp11996_c1_seq1:369-1019(-)